MFLDGKFPDDATTLGFHPKAPFASDLGFTESLSLTQFRFPG